MGPSTSLSALRRSGRFPRYPTPSDGRTSSCPAPGRACGAVLQDDTLLEQVGANGVGAGEVLRFSRRQALADQGFDGGGVEAGTGCTPGVVTVEERGGRLAGQAEG